MRRPFKFKFTDVGTGALVLSVPANLESVYYFLTILGVDITEGYFADEHWHMKLLFQGTEILVRINDSETRDVTLKTEQIIQVVHHMFMSLMDVFAKQRLSAELQVFKSQIVTG